MNTPVLLLIFNRPYTTKRVFEAIRKQQPSRLYIAADGARDHVPGEKEKSRQVREIVKNVDWDCEVKTLYRNNNIGCKTAVSQAITWFFTYEEYGIILEDDCLPDPSFFQFCEELLIKYKDDERIGHISGNCFLPGEIKKYSYDFSNTAHIWGWASWRRVWKDFDLDFPFWNNSTKADHENIFNGFYDRIYFSSFISDTLQNKKNISAWDVQYFFTMRLTNRLCIYPAVNLVTNIGLNSEGATHTSTKNRKYYVQSEKMVFPLVHPQYILRNKQLDKKAIRKHFFSWKRLMRYYLKMY